MLLTAPLVAGVSVPTASADKPKKSKSERIEEKKAERRAKEQKGKEEDEDLNVSWLVG